MKPGVPGLAALRALAANRAVELGLPQRGDEPWKYTSTAAMASGGYRPPEGEPSGEAAALLAAAATGAGIAPAPHIAGLVADLVFVNGVHVGGAFGHAVTLTEGSAPEAARRLSTLVDFRLLDRADSGGLVALNLAHLTDAALIEVPAGVRPEAPIYVQFHSAGDTPLLVSPRIVLIVGQGAQVRVIEHHTGAGQCWNNAVTEVFLEAGAQLELIRIQEQEGESLHTGITRISAAENSTVTAHDFALGAGLARSELHVRLAGPGASCTLRGLSLVDGARHSDQYTVIHHAAAHTTSAELYKGVLCDEARGAFTGRIVVEAGIRGCSTRQENPNLLLSPRAHIETRPQLEIRNNDVKAYHGATVGRLSADAIFYLRSRGLDLDHAKRVLTGAFAAEIVDAVPVNAAREHLAGLVSKALGGDYA